MIGASDREISDDLNGSWFERSNYLLIRLITVIDPAVLPGLFLPVESIPAHEMMPSGESGETRERHMQWLCEGAALSEAQSRGFEVANTQVFLVRREGRVYAYRNRCPHRGIALEWASDRFLDPSASLIQCAHHGALFLIESGECVAGPCEGQSLQPLECHEDTRGIWLHPLS
jgi:nitrite reductase/ring-hydroxylating ferredoxin subunit